MSSIRDCSPEFPFVPTRFTTEKFSNSSSRLKINAARYFRLEEETRIFLPSKNLLCSCGTRTRIYTATISTPFRLRLHGFPLQRVFALFDRRFVRPSPSTYSRRTRRARLSPLVASPRVASRRVGRENPFACIARGIPRVSSSAYPTSGAHLDQLLSLSLSPPTAARYYRRSTRNRSTKELKDSRKRIAVFFV